MKLLVHDYAGHSFPVSLSRRLANIGHRVTHAFASELLTPRGNLERCMDDPASLDLVSVPMSPGYRVNKYHFLKRLSYEHTYGNKLVRLIEELNPELILSGQTPSEPQWNLIRTARRLRIPVVTWVQDFYSMAVDKLARKKLPLFGALAGKWYRHLDGLCLRGSAGVVAITEDFRPLLHDFDVPDSRISVISNWGPLGDMPLHPRDNVWSKAHALSQKFVFLYSGTLAMKHNPDLLVQLAKHFGGDAAVRVVVVSEGPGADYLTMRKAKEAIGNMTLLPFQSFTALPEMLASADALLAVLETDAGIFSVPSKVLTYHTAMRPILAAIPAGNLAARIIKTEGSGICVEPQDVAGFIAAAEKLRADPVLRTQLASRGRAYAEREFNINLIAERFEAVFAKAVSFNATRW